MPSSSIHRVGILRLLTVLLLFHSAIRCGEGAGSEVSEGKPIVTGYVFIGNSFVAGPYWVTTTEQTVTVNQNVAYQSQVKAGPKTKIAPIVVDQDPGPPPVGSSPLDENEETHAFWTKKIVFICKTYDLATAKMRFADAVNAARSGVVARIDPGFPDGVLLKDQDGDEYYPLAKMTGSFSPSADPVAEAVTAKRHQADSIRRALLKGLIVWIVNQEGGMALIAPDKTDLFIAVMAEPVDPSLKIRKMTTLGIVRENDDLWPRLVRDVANVADLQGYLAERKNRKSDGVPSAPVIEAPRETRDVLPPATGGAHDSASASLAPGQETASHVFKLSISVLVIAVLSFVCYGILRRR